MERKIVLNAGYDLESYAQKARGKHIWIDGKKCLDFSIGGGSQIHGHSPRFIRKEICKQLKNGTIFTYPHEETKEFAEVLKEKTEYPHFVFCNSGSEAVMRAFRIARNHSKKNKIAILRDAWHGSYDGTLWKDHPLGCGYLSEHFLILSQKQNEAINKLNEFKKEIAMVFVEPVQGHCPTYQRELLTALRDWCFHNKVLFGYDEIITGFRLNPIELYGFEADLSVYGKIAGGGFPIGIVGLSIELGKIDGVFMGGTFSANPVSIRAGKLAISSINCSVLKDQEKRLDDLSFKIGKFLKKVKMVNVGTFGKVFCAFSGYQSILRRHGIHLGSNSLFFPCLLNTNKDFDTAWRAFEKLEEEI